MDISGTKQIPNQKKNRCEFDCCRRKLGIIPFECRCGKQFCGEHRLSENHNCNFDYRALHKKELLKFMSSPVIGEKVQVI
jgi:predicted nucleic acid binding AN1-type Zn finger protein